MHLIWFVPNVFKIIMLFIFDTFALSKHATYKHNKLNSLIVENNCACSSAELQAFGVSIWVSCSYLATIVVLRFVARKINIQVSCNECNYPCLLSDKRQSLMLANE